MRLSMWKTLSYLISNSLKLPTRIQASKGVNDEDRDENKRK